MWLRKDLKLRAKEAVSRNYWKTVLVSALFSLIFSGGSFFTFKLGDADEIIDDIFYAFPFGLFFMFIAGLLLIAAVILFIIFIVNPLQVGISKFRINAINNLGNISDVGTGYDVSYKRKPFEFCSEKRARIANEMKEAFNFSHGGIKKKHKKKK